MSKRLVGNPVGRIEHLVGKPAGFAEPRLQVAALGDARKLVVGIVHVREGIGGIAQASQRDPVDLPAQWRGTTIRARFDVQPAQVSFAAQREIEHVFAVIVGFLPGYAVHESCWAAQHRSRLVY
ncbi:MAG: hypothetical protein LBF91_06610 [Azoarcus sp.]|nr:hypothetical protein [Azoarcus sp.]